MILRKDSKYIERISGYKYIQELKVQTENPESRVIADKYGNICFLGNASKSRKINWVNYFTGKDADDTLYVDYKYVISDDNIQFNGMFTDTKPLEGDEAIVFDLDKCGQLDSDYIDLFFQVTQKAMINSLKKLMDNGTMKSSYDAFEPFSRVRIRMNNSQAVFCADKYKRALEPVKIITKRFNGGLHCVVYSGFNNKAVIDGNVIPLAADGLTDKLDVLLITCRASKDTNAFIRLNNCVTVMGSRGYLYLEPFSVPDVNVGDMEIEIVANRQLPLEIYDEKQNLWMPFESGMLGKRAPDHCIKMRISVETGDYVRNVIACVKKWRTI